MARPKIDTEQKKAEGRMLKAFFEKKQREETGLTQESLAAEMGITQGLIGQYFSGSTAIPDKRLLWLASRLGFDPVKFRPSVTWALSPSVGSHSKLSQVIAQIPQGEEDYIADILAPIVERLKGKD